MRKKKINLYQARENLELAIEKASKDLGLKLIGYDAETFFKRNKNQVLGIVWQLLRLDMFKGLDIEAHPGLYKLLKEGESLEDFLKQPQDKILLRWFNYHLARAGNEEGITNLGKDVADGNAYTVLLNQLDKG